MQSDDRITCATPTRGKKPTRIERWKYQRIREAILSVVPSDETGLPFKSLPSLVAAQLTAEERKQIGSMSWYTTTVKLDLETKGLLARVANVTPQHLRRLK